MTRHEECALPSVYVTAAPAASSAPELLRTLTHLWGIPERRRKRGGGDDEGGNEGTRKRKEEKIDAREPKRKKQTLTGEAGKQGELK